MASRGAVSTFDYIKTHIGEKMGYVLQEHLMPALIVGFNREDAVEISEDQRDIVAFDEAMAEKAIKKHKRKAAREGRVVFEEDLISIRESTMKDVQKNRRMEKHGKGFFNFEYGIFMNPTGESMDKAAKNASLDSVLETMAATPALVDTAPFKEKLALNGIPPFKLTPMQQAGIQESRGAKPIPEAPQDKLTQLAAV